MYIYTSFPLTPVFLASSNGSNILESSFDKLYNRTEANNIHLQWSVSCDPKPSNAYVHANQRHTKLFPIEDLRWAWLLTCRPWQHLPSAILSGKACECGSGNRAASEMAAQMDSWTILSSYMEETPKARYKEKLAMLGGVQDPYLTVNLISSSPEASVLIG